MRNQEACWILGADISPLHFRDDDREHQPAAIAQKEMVRSSRGLGPSQ